MKKYLVNRVLRSIFSIIMVMVLSVVLIFSLVPQEHVVRGMDSINSLYTQGRIDDAELEKLKKLQEYGFIEYVSQEDYCESVYPDTAGARYRACVSRLDSNEDKQNYLEKYRSLGWTEVRQTQAKNNNCENVTRAMVENGEYEKREDQYFVQLGNNPSPKDELYEEYTDENGQVKPRVVTCNNRTFFKKNINPLLTFWKWFTGLITFDHKNKIDDFKRYDATQDEYLAEVDLYRLKFFFETSEQKFEDVVRYYYNEDDVNLVNSEISYVDENENNVEYLSIAGISTGVSPKDTSISSYEVEKIKATDGSKGGSLKINVTFEDGTNKEITKEVKMYLKDNIPVYVGDDNIWYIGNTSLNISYVYYQIDWAIDIYPVAFYRELVECKEFAAGVDRGYSIEVDEYGAPALACVGCEHKYLVYFDNKFPYIHFNFIQFNLGESILGADNGKDVVEIMTDNQGNPIFTPTTYPNGNTINDSKVFHTCTYQDSLDGVQKTVFSDNYAKCDQVKEAPSRIAMSFIIGIIATFIAYFVGVPIGVLMARNKERIIDKIGMVYIIIMFAVPSLAYIYFVRSIGYNLFNLPTTHEFGQPLTYILPIISLSLGSIASMMMWTRRYIIDQENSDYVKFARAKGLSESQIFFKHILRNAIVPIAHGVPGSIIGSIAGAMITEQIYNVEGTGTLMVNSIKLYNNWAALGLIFLFSTLGVASLIMGDVVITLVDPRISFTDTGGRK